MNKSKLKQKTDGYRESENQSRRPWTKSLWLDANDLWNGRVLNVQWKSEGVTDGKDVTMKMMNWRVRHEMNANRTDKDWADEIIRKLDSKDNVTNIEISDQ